MEVASANSYTNQTDDVETHRAGYLLTIAEKLETRVDSLPREPEINDPLWYRLEAARVGLSLITESWNRHLECVSNSELREPAGFLGLGAVEVKALSAEAGITLHARDRVELGECLLNVPLSACVRSSEVSDEKILQLLNRSKVDSDSKNAFDSECGTVFDFRLAASLVLALNRGDHRAKYFEAVAPIETLESSSMLLWVHQDIGDERLNRNAMDLSESSQRESVLSGSIAHRRALLMAESADFAWKGFNKVFAADLRTPVERKLWFWALAVVETRSFLLGGEHFPNSEKILCPVVDLANHRSRGKHSVELKIGLGIGDGCDGLLCLRLVSDCRLDMGEEITLCYNPDADYLDIFERFGFWDHDAAVHTVEVQCDIEELVGIVSTSNACVKDQVDRASLQSLIQEQALIGYDEVLKTWWLPDYLVENSPLFRAVAACLSRSHHPTPQVEAARAVGDIISKQLAKYGTTLENDEESLQNLSKLAGPEDRACQLESLDKPVGCQARFVLELAIFEKRLLRRIHEMCSAMQ